MECVDLSVCQALNHVLIWLNFCLISAPTTLLHPPSPPIWRLTPRSAEAPSPLELSPDLSMDVVLLPPLLVCWLLGHSNPHLAGHPSGSSSSDAPLLEPYSCRPRSNPNSSPTPPPRSMSRDALLMLLHFRKSTQITILL